VSDDKKKKKKKTNTKINNNKNNSKMTTNMQKTSAEAFLSTVSHTNSLREYMFNIYIYTNIMQYMIFAN
jgi:hypothetical protein